MRGKTWTNSNDGEICADPNNIQMHVFETYISTEKQFIYLSYVQMLMSFFCYLVLAWICSFRVLNVQPPFSQIFIIQNYTVKRMLVISLNSCKGLNEKRIHCSSGKFESQPKAYKKGASILDVGIFEERGWGRVKMYQIYCRHGGEDC